MSDVIKVPVLSSAAKIPFPGVTIFSAVSLKACFWASVNGSLYDPPTSAIFTIFCYFLEKMEIRDKISRKTPTNYSKVKTISNKPD